MALKFKNFLTCLISVNFVKLLSSDIKTARHSVGTTAHFILRSRVWAPRQGARTVNQPSANDLVWRKQKTFTETLPFITASHVPSNPELCSLAPSFQPMSAHKAQGKKLKTHGSVGRSASNFRKGSLGKQNATNQSVAAACFAKITMKQDLLPNWQGLSMFTFSRPCPEVPSKSVATVSMN